MGELLFVKPTRCIGRCGAVRVVPGGTAKNALTLLMILMRVTAVSAATITARDHAWLVETDRVTTGRPSELGPIMSTEGMLESCRRR